MPSVEELPAELSRNIIDAAPDGIVLVEPDGTIRLANAQFGIIMGEPAEAAIGQSVDRFVPSALRSRHAGHRAAFLRSPRTRPMGSGLSLVAQRADGSSVPVEISLSPIEGPVGTLVLAIVRDVSERRRAEETIAELTRTLAERVARLESLNEELESFSYSVSHDLRAPLRAIDGFSQALLEDHGPGLPPEARGYLDRVRAGAQRMAHLIDDMLVLSRISRTDLADSQVDVSELARTGLRTLREREPDRRVEWTVADGVRLNGDSRLLQLVLDNLLANAWKFTAHRQVGLIEVTGRTLGGRPGVRISDNGVGFPQEQSDRIFAPFRRLHTSDEFEGTGVGLAIVQRIVRRHGGTIEAVGTPGRGASFTFTTGEG